MSTSAGSVALSGKSLAAGCRVRLVSLDGGEFRYECTGLVDAVDLRAADPFVRVTGCTEVNSGKREPGPQIFRQSEIVSLEVVERPDPVEAQERQEQERRHQPPGRSVSKPPRRDDNPHLRKLHPVQMPEVLRQTQIAPPPKLEPCGDLPGRPRLMPEVEQCVEHQEGELFHNRLAHDFLEIRKIVWRDADSPPGLQRYAEKVYFVDRLGSPEYEEAMRHLEEQDLVGLSLEGRLLGRAGELSLLCLASRHRVVVFDAVTAGADELLHEGEGGLRALLESPATMKVLHDCRQASDMLANRFGVRLANVYDTQAAHALSLCWMLYAGYLPKFSQSVSYMARAYLGIRGKHLFFPHYRQSQLSEDTAIWLQRPLPANLQMGAIRNVAYLLDLQIATRMCMNHPFIRATECLMGAIRDSDDMEADAQSRDNHLLPQPMVDCLPNLKPNRGRALRFGYPEDPTDEEGRKGRRMYACVGQQDPNLIFSRDCMHQNKARRRKKS